MHVKFTDLVVVHAFACNFNRMCVFKLEEETLACYSYMYL